MIYQAAAKYPVHEVIIHCAATRPGWMASSTAQAQVDEIRSWHLANGWRDIGYHWIICRDGTVVAGRAETTMGAHVQGHNRGTIGICLIGGHGSAASDRFDDHYTAEQARALISLISDIEGRTEIRKISGHNEYANKACPGFAVSEWLLGARASLAPRRPTPKVSTQPLPSLVTRILGIFA